MPYLTPAELDAIQSLPRDTPYVIEGVSSGQFSIARRNGGCTFNGQIYLYDADHDTLVRDDVMAMLKKLRRKPKAPRGPETEEMF